MTFLELQSELLTAAGARFKDGQRASAKRWINHRYAILWGLDNWTFKNALADLTVNAGDPEVTEPADIGKPKGLWNQYGEKLQYLTHVQYVGEHTASSYGGGQGRPWGYTVINKQVKLEPTPSESGTYKLLYQKAVTPLVADGDIPAFPVEYHYMLVPGATSVGAVNVNDFTYQFAEQEWQNDLQSLRAAYLADVRGEPVQWGSAY